MAESALRNISPTWWKDIKPQAPQKPVGQQMSDVLGGMALATAPIPVVGDVAGAVGLSALRNINQQEEK
jgi:phage FluMu protein gp41